MPGPADRRHELDTAELSQRTHSVEARAVDASGLVSDVVSASFVVDRRVGLGVLSPDGVVRFISALIRSDSDVPPGGVRCSLDDGPLEPCGPRFGPLEPPDGPHRLVVTAVDSTGNRATAVREYVVDRTPPDLTLLGPNGGARVDVREVTFSFSQSDAHPFSLQCRLDSGPYFPRDSAASHTLRALPDGPHTFEVNAGDLAGNGTARVADFVVDTSPAVAGASLAPALVVRSRRVPRGAVLTRLTVRHIPAGATVAVRCLGDACPRRLLVVSGSEGRLALRPFVGRTLLAGTRLRVRVSRVGELPWLRTVTIRGDGRAVVKPAG